MWRKLALASAIAVQIQCARSARPDQVVAMVGDRAITLDQVDERWSELDAASRIQVRQQLYEGRTRILDEMIGDYLIDREAAAQRMPRAQFLETEVRKRIRPIGSEDIAAAYRDAGGSARGATLEQATPMIREYLAQQRYAEARRVFVGELRKKSTEVRVSLEAPRVRVPVGPTDPALGPAGAPVTIIEFSDFQCPYCKAAGPTLKKLHAAFGDRLRIVYKDVPLPNHPHAGPAAEAAQCAHEQGRFWEYHDTLFANQGALEPQHLMRYAADVKLDLGRFSACLDSGRVAPLIQSDLAESEQYGVSSTPTFFVNGRLFTGAVPYEVLEGAVRDELSRARRLAD